ncbi:hypothetical protein ATL39_2794 [Sinobaca qinghaiensis]|uniref:Uncharacterized protein n=1 Tax=Sinobaca qinghaiensis TaxID=342944 RepID=A0A419V0D4_9BACL|nr:hypothetical protein [Sinobaca qinghaiensis]RKD71397.1 hypothetical protein ATL39_2794 [Sinobaca qinghaiensis]
MINKHLVKSNLVIEYFDENGGTDGEGATKRANYECKTDAEVETIHLMATTVASLCAWPSTKFLFVENSELRSTTVVVPPSVN